MCSLHCTRAVVMRAGLQQGCACPVLTNHAKPCATETQVALADGALAYSAVVNIPHSERYGMKPYVKLHTSLTTVG